MDHDYPDLYRCDACNHLAIVDDCHRVGEEIICQSCESLLCALCRNAFPESGMKACPECVREMMNEQISFAIQDLKENAGAY